MTLCTPPLSTPSLRALSLMAWFSLITVALMVSSTATSFLGMYVPEKKINLIHALQATNRQGRIKTRLLTKHVSFKHGHTRSFKQPLVSGHSRLSARLLEVQQSLKTQRGVGIHDLQRSHVLTDKHVTLTPCHVSSTRVC